MDINTLIAQFISGLSTAMLLFLISSGLTLIFGVVNVLNFAHGSFYLLGTYFAYQIMQLFNNFWLGLIAGAIGAGIVGMVIEFFFPETYLWQSTRRVVPTAYDLCVYTYTR